MYDVMRQSFAYFTHFFFFFLEFSGGRTIAKTVTFELHILHSFRPDIVIVQLGTIDLTSCPPLRVGSALEDFAHLLHDSHGVRGVCAKLV